MKRLALLAIPFLLASPTLAADLDYPRHAKRKVYIEQTARIVERRYQPIPSALYDNFGTGQFNSYVWRPLPRSYTYWRPHHYYHHQGHHGLHLR